VINTLSTRDWHLVGEQVLDSNGSGGLTSLEFCAAMKKLVRALDRA
jgi:hypothetical protein